MRFGEYEEHLEELADDDPDRIPEALLTKPETPEHLAAAIEAFRALSRRRPMAVGMTAVIYLPIQAGEAMAMAEAIGWPPLEFLAVISPADELYVERLNQKTR